MEPNIHKYVPITVGSHENKNGVFSLAQIEPSCLHVCSSTEVTVSLRRGSTVAQNGQTALERKRFLRKNGEEINQWVLPGGSAGRTHIVPQYRSTIVPQYHSTWSLAACFPLSLSHTFLSISLFYKTKRSTTAWISTTAQTHTVALVIKCPRSSALSRTQTPV